MAEGIRYAAANGARIINLSLETPTDDRRVRAAIKAAQAADVLIVCSAGNTGTDIDRRPLFPVAIPAPNLVGVGATAPADGLALTKFSNYGSLTVPVAAPGEGVVSTSRDGGYETRSGTSMAAPHVAGVAALMASANPRLSAAELRALLLEHAVRAPEAGRPGSVEALASVQAAMRTPPDPLDQAAAGPHRLGDADRGRAARAVPRRGHRGPLRAPEARRRRRSRRAHAGAFARPVVLRRTTGRRLVVEALGADGRVLATAAAFVNATPPPPPPTLRLAGSAAAGEALAELLKAAQAPDVRIELVGGGTGMGIADAARGIVDAGLTSRSIFPADPQRPRLHPVRRARRLPGHQRRPDPAPGRGCRERRAGRVPRGPRDSAARACSPAPPTPPPTCAATPGAWGYVDPRRQRGPAGRPRAAPTRSGSSPAAPRRRARRAAAHDRRPLDGYAHRRDGRAAHRARDPGRQPPLPRRGGGVLRRQVGHLVRRDRPPAGAGQAHQAARPEAGPVRALAGDRLRHGLLLAQPAADRRRARPPPARTSAPACWRRSSATRTSSASTSRPRPATPPSCRSRTRASTSCSATPCCTTCPTSTARFAEFKRVLKPGGMLFFAGEPSRQRRPHRRRTPSAPRSRPRRCGARRSRRGPRRRTTARPTRTSTRSRPSSTSTPSSRPTSSATRPQAGFADVRVRGRGAAGELVRLVQPHARGERGAQGHPAGLDPVRLPRLHPAPARGPRAARAAPAAADLLQPDARRAQARVTQPEHPPSPVDLLRDKRAIVDTGLGPVAFVVVYAISGPEHRDLRRGRHLGRADGRAAGPAQVRSSTPSAA